jgi:hypothetical protein
MARGAKRRPNHSSNIGTSSPARRWKIPRGHHFAATSATPSTTRAASDTRSQRSRRRLKTQNQRYPRQASSPIRLRCGAPSGDEHSDSVGCSSSSHVHRPGFRTAARQSPGSSHVRRSVPDWCGPRSLEVTSVRSDPARHPEMPHSLRIRLNRIARPPLVNRANATTRIVTLARWTQRPVRRFDFARRPLSVWAWRVSKLDTCS